MFKRAEMRVFHGFEELEKISNPVLTIGTFDGVHLGHQKIIEQLNEKAKEIGGESVLFTFSPHPRMVLFPENNKLKLIQTQEEKIDKLRRMGLQNIVIQPFTKEFSRLSATVFVRDHLVNKLKIKHLIIGYDHQFGKNREGNIDFLKEISGIYDFEVTEISAQDIDEVNISSTKIRNAILEGKMELAEQYLGEPFEVSGTIVHGEALGRSLDFPTANIDVGSSIKIIPQIGVYAVNVILENGRIAEGMMNIGQRPTITNHNNISIEVHLFDFRGDLYGQFVTTQLLSRFRDEKQFNDIYELKEQIKQDEREIRSYFASVNSK